MWIQQRGPYFIIFKLFACRLQYSVSLINILSGLTEKVHWASCSSPPGFGINELFQEVKLPPLYSYPLTLSRDCVYAWLKWILHARFRTRGFSMLSPLVGPDLRHDTSECSYQRTSNMCRSSQLLLPANTVLFAVQRTGYNQTKDRVSPSSSLLISNKMASKSKWHRCRSVQSPMQWSYCYNYQLFLEPEWALSQ